MRVGIDPFDFFSTEFSIASLLRLKLKCFTNINST